MSEDADDEDLDDTVITPRRPSGLVPDDLDEETLIRPRSPFADVPVEALEMFLGKEAAQEYLRGAADPASVEPPPLIEPPVRRGPPVEEPSVGQEPPARPASAVPPEPPAPPPLDPGFTLGPDLGIYHFRVRGSEPIPLDVPAFIGRRPSSPRIASGRIPRLVKVPSPSREVSGTHLEVRQHGTSVVVTDLRSTNGTIVRMPGSAPLKLRQGESLVVLPGTVVDIGDENILEILPIRPVSAQQGVGRADERPQQ